MANASAYQPLIQKTKKIIFLRGNSILKNVGQGKISRKSAPSSDDALFLVFKTYVQVPACKYQTPKDKQKTALQFKFQSHRWREIGLPYRIPDAFVFLTK